MPGNRSRVSANSSFSSAILRIADEFDTFETARGCPRMPRQPTLIREAAPFDVLARGSLAAVNERETARDPPVPPVPPHIINKVVVIAGRVYTAHSSAQEAPASSANVIAYTRRTALEIRRIVFGRQSHQTDALAILDANMDGLRAARHSPVAVEIKVVAQQDAKGASVKLVMIP